MTQPSPVKWCVTKGEDGAFELVEAHEDDARDQWSDGAIYGLFDTRTEALQSYIDDMIAAKRAAQDGIRSARRMLRRERKKEDDGRSSNEPG